MKEHLEEKRGSPGFFIWFLLKYGMKARMKKQSIHFIF